MFKLAGASSCCSPTWSLISAKSKVLILRGKLIREQSGRSCTYRGAQVRMVGSVLVTKVVPTEAYLHSLRMG